jgi:hypothetical protein
LIKPFRRFRRVTAVLFLVSLSKTVMAGPPFFTDDPVPVELKHSEIYFASQYLRTADDRSGVAPLIDANYGAFPNLHVHMSLSGAFDHPAGGATAYGYGDTELGVKYRFAEESGYQPQAAVYPTVEVPTGDADRGLGNGHVQIYLPLWLQKTWAPWTTYGGGGYWINPGEGHRNGSFLGWVLQRDLSERLSLGAEIYHRDIETVDGPTGTGFTAGGQVNFGEHYHLLLSLGRDFSGPDHLTRYLALQWTF